MYDLTEKSYTTADYYLEVRLPACSESPARRFDECADSARRERAAENPDSVKNEAA